MSGSFENTRKFSVWCSRSINIKCNFTDHQFQHSTRVMAICNVLMQLDYFQRLHAYLWGQYSVPAQHHVQRCKPLTLYKNTRQNTYTAFSQSWDDISKSRQWLVDVLGLIEHSTFCSSFTNLHSIAVNY